MEDIGSSTPAALEPQIVSSDKLPASYIAKKIGNVWAEYTVRQAIGGGNYSQVFIATHNRTQELYAVKCIKKLSSRRVYMLCNELTVIHKTDHPNIVKCYEIWESADTLSIVFEYCQGGELFSYIVQHGCFDEQTTKRLFVQLLRAVCHLHSQSIVHRDLKPENLLLDGPGLDSTLKLIDFGFSREIMSEELLNSNVGTLFYISPDVLQGQYSMACDIWSLGVILYVLLSGTPPFFGQTTSELLYRIRAGHFIFHEEKFAHISAEVKDLICRMLILNPEERITAQDIFSHSWMQNVDTYDHANDVVNVQAIQNLAATNPFQRAALIYIARNSQNANLTQLIERFNHVNKDQSGIIKFDQVLKAKAEFGIKLDPSKLKILFKKIAFSNKGGITFTDFLSVNLVQSGALLPSTIKQAFDYFDKQGSQSIRPEDICTTLTELLGQQFTLEQCVEMMALFDTNRDGVIDIGEFTFMLNPDF